MMEVALSSTAERNRKRKIRAEPRGVPLPKHVCWDQKLECDSPSHPDTELKSDTIIFARGNESDPESAKDSNSLHTDEDSLMSVECQNDTCTSTSSCGGASSGINCYSLDRRSLTTSNCSKSESVSNYEDQFSEYGSRADCCYSDDGNDGMEYSTDKELEELLYSNGIAPGDYVLSSGRWSVNQGADTQQQPRKMTIDKEFEEYFSTLML